MSPFINHVPRHSPTDNNVPRKSAIGGYSLPDMEDIPQASSLTELTMNDEESLSMHINDKRPVYIDMDHLSLASVVAVARIIVRYFTRVELADASAAASHVGQCVDFLSERLERGDDLYGITTGFGGSAGQRTDKTMDLQRALLQHQHCGILPVKKQTGSMHATFNHSGGADYMPEMWVRGAMLIRCKSLLNAHSAVRFEVIELLIALLNNNLVPLVPLRGSISASGDLQPLSYIAGVLEGNPDMYVWTDDSRGGRDLIPADAALELLNRQSITFGPKEALGVLNGTAVSTAVAALALEEADKLALLTQVLTAMGTEARLGSLDSFSPFFSEVRPHPGQNEVAGNIRRFLHSSKLVHSNDETTLKGLKQDRYSLRTSPQWIGPCLEDLSLAHAQLKTEINSTTDNPLIDITTATIHHGGNFQALSTTSAMEKTRASLALLGRMLFSQCTELLNPDMNSGLPPNLAADDPSTSYTMKGADINVAAYTSELGFLANPVSSHVQTAEMGNQGINSLALIAARYTHSAADCLSMISATYLYILCQALDIRAMNLRFEAQLPKAIDAITREAFGSVSHRPSQPGDTSEEARNEREDEERLKSLVSVLTKHVLSALPRTTHMDAPHRFHHIAQEASILIVDHYTTHASTLPPTSPLLGIALWKKLIASNLHNGFVSNRENYFRRPTAGRDRVLGRASQAVHGFVRGELGVGMYKGLREHPVGEKGEKREGGKTIGSGISVIHEAIREGRIVGLVRGLMGDG
ncbi:hypothetical protein ACLMJK_006271 [Lecanora helva]